MSKVKKVRNLKTGELENCTVGDGCRLHEHALKGLNKKAVEDIASEIDVEEESPYTKKRVLYHYACDNCSMPFEGVKTVAEMDEQVKAHDCDNLTDFEAHKVRKVLKQQMGYTKWREATEFKSEHEQCKSYQTACTECAEQHEMNLYNFFTFNEMSNIVRPDSMFYKKKEGWDFISDDLPERWQYLRGKNGTQLEFERQGINFGNHLDDGDSCRVCNQYSGDAYCMDCWSPSGYLYEDENF
jgi:hypothetical protein